MRDRAPTPRASVLSLPVEFEAGSWRLVLFRFTTITIALFAAVSSRLWRGARRIALGVGFGSTLASRGISAMWTAILFTMRGRSTAAVIAGRLAGAVSGRGAGNGRET